MKKFGCYGSLMIFFLAIFCCKAFSQAPPRSQGVKITVTGLVTDTAGKKIEGASVVSQNRRNVGTSTDVNGRFILDVESGSVAALASPRFSVISGGLACVVGVAGIVFAFPKLLAFDAEQDHAEPTLGSVHGEDLVHG